MAGAGSGPSGLPKECCVFLWQGDFGQSPVTKPGDEPILCFQTCPKSSCPVTPGQRGSGFVRLWCCPIRKEPGELRRSLALPLSSGCAVPGHWAPSGDSQEPGTGSAPAAEAPLESSPKIQPLGQGQPCKNEQNEQNAILGVLGLCWGRIHHLPSRSSGTGSSPVCTRGKRE